MTADITVATIPRAPVTGRPPWETAQLPAITALIPAAIPVPVPGWQLRLPRWLRRLARRLRDAAGSLSSLLDLPEDAPSFLLPFPGGGDVARLLWLAGIDLAESSTVPAEVETTTNDNHH